MLTGLQSILEKDPVVSTVNADDLLNRPQTVESSYTKHVETFIPMGEVIEFSDRFAERIVSSKTPKGLIIAPYGYGKTSTAAFLWRNYENNDLLTTPPFYCSQMLDVLKATFGWVKYRLKSTEPQLINDLEEVYKKYTAATVEDMADRYSREHGLATVTARNMLNEMLEDGSLVLELTPSNLLFFLDATAGIAIRAGFKGLVVLPDEFQQYFSKGANLRRTIQEFREFVWGLDTRSSSLGVLFSLPTYAESIVQEQGRDILHRLKKDGFYYRLQDIYTIDFPAQLWERYVDAFELNDISGSIIDSYTLRSIGQIAERDDLGEGPRTVVDSFKRAIIHYQDHNKSYKPIDLIDDFLESNINFQSQANKLKTVIRQALNSAVVNTPKLKQAVKLLAAFPRGCPVSVQKHYQVYDEVNSLSKQVHGELMTHLVEGYTLLGLSRTGGPTHTVDIIITQFWQSFEEDELHVEAAIRAFCNRFLPRFFEQRRGASATGWGSLNFSPTISGSYSALIEGTFNPRFPHRLLSLQIAQDEDQLQTILSEADLQFDFLFHLYDHEYSGELLLVSDRSVQFNLNMRQKVGPALPDDLRKLQEFVNPEFVTPLLMLGLVDFFDRWGEIEEKPIPESDRSEIEFFVGRLIDHSTQTLFNNDLATTIEPSLRRVGRLMLEEIFNRLCSNLYSDYHTFYTHAQYEKVLNDYMNAMRAMTLKERRGNSALEGTKESLAQRFSLTSVATFENRIDSEYKELMEKVEWEGRGERSIAKIKLKLHPLEEEILRRLRESGSERQIDNRSVPFVDSTEVAKLAHDIGYRDEETLLALKLLAARGYTRFDKEDKLIYLAQVGPDPKELQVQFDNLAKDIEVSEDILLEGLSDEIIKQLTEIQKGFEAADQNEEELDELQTKISDLRLLFDRILSEKRSELRQQLNTIELDIDRALVGLHHNPSLERNIEGQVAFVMHLNELRQRLMDERRGLVEQYNELKASLNGVTTSVAGGSITAVQSLHQALLDSEQRKSELQDVRKVLESQTSWLEEWIHLLRDTERLFNALSRLPDLRRQITQEIIPEIQAHLTKQRLNGLSDWEPFKAKVDAVEEELEKRRRHGNELFGEEKSKYEQFLREIDVGDYRPRSRYTYGEDQGSYRDLYEEVRIKIASRLDDIESDLHREKTDLLKAKHITFIQSDDLPIIQNSEKKLADAEKILHELRNSLTLSLIKEGGDDLEVFGNQTNELTKFTTEVRELLGPTLFADHELTASEQQVLQSLGKHVDIDLTDLFVDLHLENSEISLSELLSILESLYRKHRLTIRVRPRG